jgi:nicotinamide-nucleotide amidase
VLLQHGNTIIIAMPGVPPEMRGIMTDHVLPLLQQRIDAERKPAREYRVLQTTGIAESNLADLIGEPSQFLGTSTLAFLPNYQGVRLRIGALGTTVHERTTELDRITSIITERAGRFIFSTGERTLSSAVGERLLERHETVAVAESCTGGLLGAAFTDIPGSSAWFEGGVLTYSNAAKTRELNVPTAVLNNVGAVSEAVAVLMAMRVREKFGTTWGIGVTGVAGPGGGTEEKPVGLVWIAVAGPDGVKAVKHLFGTDRRINRERTVGAALGMLWSQL